MVKFETVNELTLRVTCTGQDTIFAKTGAFIAGDNMGQKNYAFEKVLLGPEQGIGQALLGSLVRRVTGENIPLMKVTMSGDSVTYYASYGRHVIVYKIAPGETVSVESENILAFTSDCKYGVRFIGCGILSQKGLATTTLTAMGDNAYVAILATGNPIVLDNTQTGNTICVDPDAVICWMSQQGNNDPQIATDISWRNLIGQHSGESYSFTWNSAQRVSVIVQPSERYGGISVSMD